MTAQPEVARLTEVMATLRRQCPWDRSQTARSLVQYLVEETLEVVEAIETGDREHLREELGDLLLQVVFHAEIAAEQPGGFDLEDVARGVADKLVERHPHVFAVAAAGAAPETRSDEQVLADLNTTWEQRKAAQKGRTSVLDGIPDRLSALAKAQKVIGRARAVSVPVDLPDDLVAADDLGARVLDLVARAQATGLDAEQAVRDAVRGLEERVSSAEAAARSTRGGDGGPR